MPASTGHRVLVRAKLNRLDQLDRVTRQPLRRFEMRTVPPETSTAAPSGELSERIAAQLDRIMARSQSLPLDSR